MATLTLPPTNNAAGQAATQQSLSETPAADLGGMESEWVLLGESDIVPADVAAAAGHHGLNFSPLPMMPIWVQMVLGGVVYTAVPFYKRAMKIEGETLANVETAVEVVEHVAEVTEKLAANAADSLPEDGCLHKLAVEIEYIAEVVDNDAHKVEAIINKGWRSGIDYTDWTSGKTFAVGDKLFFSYGSQYHTVTEVSKSGYYSCSGSDALSEDDTSGWTVVTLTAPGTRYFICNIPGLCSSGMKLSVTVAESGPVPTSDAARGTLQVPSMGSVVVVAVATAGALIKLALF